MSDRLSDEQVAWLADPDGRYPLAVLAREVRMRRKQDAEDARVLERLADILDAIDALHQPDWPDNSGRNPAFAFCRECRDNWPCPTNLILHPENDQP